MSDTVKIFLIPVIDDELNLPSHGRIDGLDFCLASWNGWSFSFFFLAKKFELRSFSFENRCPGWFLVWILAQPTALVLVAYFGTEDGLWLNATVAHLSLDIVAAVGGGSWRSLVAGTHRRDPAFFYFVSRTVYALFTWMTSYRHLS